MKIFYLSYDIERDLVEFFFVPDQGEKPQLKEVIVYDSSLSTEDKLYSKLLDCIDTKSIINFYQQYGPLNNPYHYVSSDSHRNFPGLCCLIEDASKAMYGKKWDSEMKNGIIPYSYFGIYYSEMKMLDYINHFLKTSKKHMSEFIRCCRNFLYDDRFYDLLCLEYNNVLDDIAETLKATPIYYLRYLLAISDLDNISSSDLKEKLTNINLDKRIIDGLFKIKEYSEFSDCDFDEKTITQIAKQISTDMIKFHLHDIDYISLISVCHNDSTEYQYNFSSLASAIFFHYYVDSMGGIEFRKCANPSCEKMFCCQKRSTQKYCDENCAHRARQNRFRKRHQH